MRERPRRGCRHCRRRLKVASVGNLYSGLHFGGKISTIFFKLKMRILMEIKIVPGPGSNFKILIFRPEFELSEMTDCPVTCSRISMRSLAEIATMPDQEASTPSVSMPKLAPACCRGWILSSRAVIFNDERDDFTF